MRRPSRLALAVVSAALPLSLLTACASDDGAVRSENGTGVDDKSTSAPGEDGDQSDTDDEEDEG